MTRLVASHIESLVPYVPGKAVEQLERELGIEGAVQLASNENPMGASPLAIEAARGALAHIHRYPDDQVHELRKRLGTFHALSPGEIALGHGSNELIDLIVRTFAIPCEHAVIGTPSFASYALSLAAAMIPTTSVPLRDGLFWDLRAVLEAVRSETKLVFIDNPGNPTSTHVASGALREFLTQLPSHVIAVIDEAYCEYATAEDYATALTMRELRERLIVLRTFSKAYGLAALRLGYAVAPAELIEYLQRVRVPFSANAIAQTAARGALEDVGHLQRAMALNARERARMIAALTRLGLSVPPSQTNFVCTHVKRPSAHVYQALLQRGVIVRPFGPPLAEHIRVSVGMPAENDSFLAALVSVLAQIPESVSAIDARS